MKAKRVRDVRELLRSQRFGDWHQGYHQVRHRLLEDRHTRDELLADLAMAQFRVETLQQAGDDAVLRAGELEDLAARAHAEFTEIENASFEAVSAFEAQRRRAVAARAEYDRQDNALESLRQKAFDVRAKAEVVRRRKAAQRASEGERLRAQLQHLDAEIAEQNAHAEAARRHMEAEKGRSEAMWYDVEESWSRSFHAILEKAERDYQARRMRTDAEKRFALAHQERRRSEALRGELQQVGQRIEAAETEYRILLQQAREDFEATIIDEFLYWPEHENVKMALCAPLIDEPALLNIQVKALRVYRIDRLKGIGFLEPVPESESHDDEDPRLEAFFFEGRPVRSA